MFTLNGLLDIFSKNITTTILDQLPDADVAITSNEDSYIYNYSTLINSIEQNDPNIKAVIPRYAIDSGIYLSSNNQEFVIPVQIIAINFTRENEINLGTFTPTIQSLKVNECLAVGNFGTQILSSSTNSNIDVSMLLNPNYPVNLSLKKKTSFVAMMNC